jgi:hypothetical protein
MTAQSFFIIHCQRPVCEAYREGSWSLGLLPHQNALHVFEVAVSVCSLCVAYSACSSWD